jgi:hypothetical protein
MNSDPNSIFDEIVVFEKSQSLPRYLFHVDRTGTGDTAAKPLELPDGTWAFLSISSSF